MNNCKDCTQFLRFETTGIKEVPGDGMCMKAGKDQSHNWVFVMLEHSCFNFQNKHKSVAPLRIIPASGRPNVIPPMPTIPELREKPAGGNCVDCVNWKRKGFSPGGECWSADSINNGTTTLESRTCSYFHPHANNNAHIGDIVEVQVGEQWQLVFIGTNYIVVHDRMGVEKVFDKKGLRFRKCQS